MKQIPVGNSYHRFGKSWRSLRFGDDGFGGDGFGGDGFGDDGNDGDDGGSPPADGRGLRGAESPRVSFLRYHSVYDYAVEYSWEEN